MEVEKILAFNQKAGNSNKMEESRFVEKLKQTESSADETNEKVDSQNRQNSSSISTSTAKKLSIPSERSAFRPYNKGSLDEDKTRDLDTAESDKDSAMEADNTSATSTGHQKVDRRPRTTFSAEQTRHLESEYASSEYVSRAKRLRLSESLNLNEGQIKIWFQNRRAKDKRIEKAHMDSRLRYFAQVALQPAVASMAAAQAAAAGNAALLAPQSFANAGTTSTVTTCS